MARDDEMMTPGDDASDALVPSWTADGHLDEGTIHTWLDGAFDSAQAAVVAAHVDACAVCRESVAEARGLIAGASRMVRALDVVPGGVVPEADVARVASRIVAAAAVADVTGTAHAPKRARRAWYTQPVMRAAAAVLVMVAGGTYVWSRIPVTPTTDARAGTERSVASSTPLMEAPKSVAASEPGASAAPTVRPAPPTQDRAMRNDVTSRGAAAPVGKSMPAIASQKLEDRPSQALAKIGERRQVAADVAAPAAPPRAVNDSAMRVLTGRITTSSGVPAAGVHVSATGLRTADATTDSTGAYRMRVAGDSVVVVARRLGFAASRQVLDLRGRDSARVDLKMDAMVQQLNAVTVAGARGVPESAMGISTSISAKSAESVRTAMMCWSVDAGDDVTGRLPTHLAVPTPVGGRPLRTQWINWPTIGRTTSVEMSSEGAGRQFTGASIANGDTVTIAITRRGDGWTGILARSGATPLQRPILLTNVPDSVCKL